MARIELPAGDGEERDRLWSLRPELAEAADAFSRIVQERTIIPPREHEAARIRIAHLNGCELCSEARLAGMADFGLDESFYSDVDDPALRGRYTEREALAIEFAERFASGATAFDDMYWARLRRAFSDPEIVDLAASCAKWLGLGRINAVFGVVSSCPVQISSPRQQASAA